MVVRVMRGRLLMGAAVLGQSMPSRRVHQVVPQVVRQTRVVIMQHWTRNRTILRGTRNRHDPGLFQMNTVVSGQKAQKLGYDIRTLEGNAHMARCLFAMGYNFDGLW
jgi:hypothetical protein